MPTTIRTRSLNAVAVERLSWPDTARFMVLLLRVRRLNRGLKAANRRVGRYGFDSAGAELALTMQRWLACHEAISALLGRPEPPHVAQVRETLRGPKAGGEARKLVEAARPLAQGYPDQG